MASRRKIIPGTAALVLLSWLVLLSGCGGGGGGGNTPPAPTITSVTVTCNPTSVQTGQTSQCTATVTGTGSYSSVVTWSASAGTINSSGLFTAPSAAGTVTVTATSTQDATKSGTATITVTLPPPTITSVSVTCNPTLVQIGQTSQCTATVTGTGAFDNAVHWLVNDVEGGNTAVGTISTSGFYTAPASVPLPNLLTVEATSVADPSKSGASAVIVEDIPLREGGTFSDPLGTETIVVGGRTVGAAKDQVLVYLKEDVTNAEVASLQSQIRSVGGSVIGSLLATRTVQVSIPPTADENVFIRQMLSVPGVVAAGANEVLSLEQDNSRAYSKSRGKVARFGLGVIPKVPDPLLTYPDFTGNYWISQTRAAEAWDVTTGSAVDDAIIGIVDTGIEKDQIVLQESRLQRYDKEGNPLTDDDTKEAEDGYHGKWVTGFAAGYEDQTDNQVRGVAWNNRVIMVDVAKLGDEECTVEGLGLRLFCTKPILLTDFHLGVVTAMGYGAKVINVSLGPKLKPSDDHQTKVDALMKFREALTPIVNAARSNDRLLVFAAGNDYEKQDDQFLPTGSAVDADAWTTNALRVAATNQDKADADFSNMGQSVDIAAPGDHVAFRSGSGWLGRLEEWMGLTTGSGTSFAAPLVGGAAGLMRSVSPTVSSPEMRSILLNGAEKLSIARTPNLLLNMQRAVIDTKAIKDLPLEVLPEVSLSSGETKNVSFSVTLPTATVSSMDVLFLIDTTSSYGDDIDTLQSKATEILNNLSSRGIDFQFGVASFADFPFPPYGDPSYGDQAFYLNQPITNNLEAVQAAISQLDNPLHYGADTPESQLEALYQAATGSGRDVNGDGDYNDLGDLAPSNIGWRTGSLKVVILATDAPFHNPELELYFGATFGQALDALKAKGITVIGLDSGSAGADLSRVVDETGGTLYALSSDSSEIADSIYQGITNHLQQVTLSVEKVSGQEWVPSVDPSSFSNVPAGESRTFTVTLEGKKRNGIAVQNYNVFLWVRADNSAIEKRVRIPIVVPSE
jgi:subtilisin family serine protease